MSFTSSVLDLFRFDGTTALVTGGNGGIGAAMVTSLAEAGADIIIIQISGDTSNFHETISAIGRKAAVYDCDLADVKCIRECIAKILSDGNVIDILINCAGVSGHRPILDIDDTFREKIFNINMTATYVITQEVGRHMIARGKGGKVLNISSMAGLMAGKNISAYAGTKGAVNQFTSAFANEWAEYNIQVNCVCPGYILTPLTKGYFENSKFTEYMLSRIPTGRLGLPDDFKGLTLFFCSSASNYVTGVRMPIDGGLHGN